MLQTKHVLAKIIHLPLHKANFTKWILSRLA
ncbi:MULTISPECIES: hypothetical protein [Tindallia]